jgi:hypothetical protein
MILWDLATTHMVVAVANIWFQLMQLQDMDYLLWVQIIVCFSIFCWSMSSEHPKRYLTINGDNLIRTCQLKKKIIL